MAWGVNGLTLDEYLLDVLGPDLAAVLEELVVLAGGGEVVLGAGGEGLHAAVGGGGETGGGRGEGREGILAAAVSRSDFPPHEGDWITREEDMEGAKGTGRAGGDEPTLVRKGNIYTVDGQEEECERSD